MSIFKANIDFILPIIAILSFVVLASSHSSRSAIILLIQTIFIDIYIGINHGINTAIFGASILLTFFCLIVVGSNHYLELSFKKASSKPPKLNFVVCVLLFILFWRHTRDLFSAREQIERLYFLNVNYDGLSLMVAGFALFAILVSSLIIFDLKNQKPGDQT